MSAKSRGALLGTLLGDAFGLPFEGAVPGPKLSSEVARRAEAPGPWAFSDDGEMAIGVAESLAEKGGVDGAHLLATLAKNQTPSRKYGHGMKTLLQAVRDGRGEQATRELWREGSRGNGSSVRVAPVACAFAGDPKRLAEEAAASSKVSHVSPEAIAGAVLQAAAIGAALRGDPVFPAIRAALPAEAGAFPDRLAKLEALLGKKAPIREAAGVLGTGVLAVDSLPFAWFCFLRSVDVKTTLVEAVSAGGDTDTIAAMIGALLGAAGGEEALPADWLARLENGPKGRDYARALADRLVR